MNRRIRGISGLLIGLIVGLIIFGHPSENRSTITDSVVQPTSGQTVVQITNKTTGHGHVEIKTQTTTSQAGKTVSRQTTTSPQGQQQTRGK